MDSVINTINCPKVVNFEAVARLQLEIPAHLPFETVIPIRITDLNYGGHLGNDALLSLMHEARMQFLASHGFTELDAGGASFIMGDCAIVYKAEGFYGHRLRVQMGAGDYSRVGFDLYYRFLIEGENKELAVAKTGIVMYNYEAKKVVQVPEILRNKFKND
jgi:acyl-CoA thioester hydrolase